jgi:putative ABC transport system permease protein
MMTVILCCFLLSLLYNTFDTAKKNPHLRRMAVRNLTLHKNTAVLTVLGAMVGTALITSALLLKHSVDQSRETVLKKQFGNIAYDLPAAGQERLDGGYFDEAAVEELREKVKKREFHDVDGLLPTVSLLTAVKKKDARGRTVLIQPGVYVHGFDPEQAREFDQQAMNGVPTLADDEILLSDLLASRLEVKAGDEVTLAAGKDERTFTVAKVMPEQGLTGYRGTMRASGTAIVSEAAARDLSGVPQGEYTNLLFARKTSLFRGSAEDDRSPMLMDGWTDVPVRGEAADDVEHSMKLMPIFSIASFHAIAIGMMLIVNIFKMIAEERRQEIGVLRAVGMTRQDLVKLLRLEGALYALVSGIVGVLTGILLSYGLLSALRDPFARVIADTEGIDVQLEFAVSAFPILKGFAIGVLLILLCSYLVAKKAADITIVNALQTTDAARSGLYKSRKQSLVRTSIMLFSCVLTSGLFLLTLTESFRAGLRDGFPRTFPIFVFLLGFLFTAMAVFTMTMSLHRAALAVQWLFRPFARLSAVLRLSFRYPEVRRMRTGLLVLMFAMVFFLASLSGVFNETFSGYLGGFDARVATGGYDLTATAQGRMLTTEDLQTMLQQSGYVKKAVIDSAASVWQVPLRQRQMHDFGERKFWDNLNGIDESFAKTTELKLIERDPKYASDREAWLAVANDPQVMIVSERTRQGEQLGDLLEIPHEGTIQKRIIGFAAYDNQSYGFPASAGVFVKQSEVLQHTSDAKLISSELLIRMKEGQVTAEAAKEIEKALTLHNIYPLRNPKAEFLAAGEHVRMLFNTFEGFSLLATLIGIGGLVIIMFRVIRERRQQIGMLRAIGVRPGTIYWCLFLEGSLIGVGGITLGMLTGSYFGALMVELFAAGEGLLTVFPYEKLAWYFGGTMLVTLIGLMFPARKVMKLPPAEATRYVG